MDTAIKIENLGKLYRIGEQSPYRTLCESITSTFSNSFRRLKRDPAEVIKEAEYIWALKDVSFEVKRGEVVGIIGRNGAGKTTLLKILSRITAPTEGYAEVCGRVGSLLEVGTGFHPELTGRDNIYLNGAILGMKKREIDRKFDEIVAFAEVEKFIDTPIKHYSSGMYVRLGFAVAAHLEPEILLVDEVLAVGDINFQNKCLGKMGDIASTGRTVLFVSHNLGMITQLCSRSIYLKSGQVVCDDGVDAAVLRYIAEENIFSSHKQLVSSEEEARKQKKLFFKEVTLVNDKGAVASEIDVRYPFYLNFEYEVTQPLDNVELSVRIDTGDSKPLFTSHQSDYSHQGLNFSEAGRHQVSITFPAMFLMPGLYLITIAAHEPMVQFFDIHEHVLSFSVVDTGTRFSRYQQYHRIGCVIVDLPWRQN